MAPLQSYLVHSNPRAALYPFILPFAAAHNKYVATCKERWHRLVDRGWTASGHGVFILNFPLGEDRVCWCYLNHCVNLVIDECKVNGSIKVLQSCTERSPHRVTGRAWGCSRFAFFSLLIHWHTIRQDLTGDMPPHENLTRVSHIMVVLTFMCHS